MILISGMALLNELGNNLYLGDVVQRVDPYSQVPSGALIMHINSTQLPLDEIQPGTRNVLKDGSEVYVDCSNGFLTSENASR